MTDTQTPAADARTARFGARVHALYAVCAHDDDFDPDALQAAAVLIDDTHLLFSTL